jgi:hypothetical protein
MSCREYVLSTAVVRAHIGRTSFGGRQHRRRHTFSPVSAALGSIALCLSARHGRIRFCSKTRMQRNFKLQSPPGENAQSVVVGADRLNVDTIKSYE